MIDDSIIIIMMACHSSTPAARAWGRAPADI
jgi:hypothetical protein